jgi:hypothetical protein
MAVPIFEHLELCPCYFTVFYFHLDHLEGCIVRHIKVSYYLERRM